MLQKMSIFTRQTPRVFGEGWGSLRGTTGTSFLALLRKDRALFAASSDPTGGRRPCPSGDSLTDIDSRAKGILPPQGKP